MNLADIAIILILIIFILEGINKSFIAEVLDFVSFFIAFILSLKFFSLASTLIKNLLGVPFSFSNVIGFVIVWFLVEITLFLIVHVMLHKFKSISVLDKHLKSISWVPSLFRGLIFTTIVLILFGSFPIQPLIKSEITNSKIGSIVLSQTQNLEIPLNNIFGGFAQETITFFTIKPQSNESIDLGFKTDNFSASSVLERQMITLVNQERVKKGLKALEPDSTLQDIARSHSKDMFERGYFSHYSPEGESVANRAQKVGFNYTVIGENLAYAPNLQLAHNGLMNSPGHRANILSPDYNKIGIGIMDSKDYGLMITQVFSN